MSGRSHCRSLLAGLTTLVLVASAAPADATVAGTNGRIAFVRTGSLTIETMAADGSDVSVPLATGFYPSWSPDGAKIVYFAQSVGVKQIFVMDADGGHQAQLTHEPAGTDASDPVWSPDGSRIAFTRSANSRSQIAVMDANGSHEAGLTASGVASDDRPNWSPDGARIAFDSDRSGRQEVWLMNADGSSPQQLTTDPEFGFSGWPNWSPDGTRIAFESNRDNIPLPIFANKAEVYVMDANGSAQTRLTHDGASDERPSWAPDGTAITYSHATLNGTGGVAGVQVFVMGANGGNQHQLAPSATEPDWQAMDVDSDGDGLPDTWETNGVDTDGDGQVDLDLPAMGANPRHKDVFLEIDPMPAQEISQAAVDAIVVAFGTAPVPDLDGTTGIELHVDDGPGSVMNPRTGQLWGARSEQDGVPFASLLGSEVAGEYDWSDFDALRDTHFSPAREPAFHYVIAAHDHDLPGHSGISRETPGGDLIISLGAYCRPNLTCTVPTAIQAGTLMHELGHNLGLHHGGADDFNEKPNYESIMNYAYQFTGMPRADGTTSLDYSRFALGLDERKLDERTGFGAAAGSLAAGFLGLGVCPGGSTKPLWPLRGQVDFNCDGPISPSPIRADVNGDTVVTSLSGFEDWSHLKFKGGAIGLLGAPAPPQRTEDDEPPITQLLAYQHTIDEALAAIRNPPSTGGGPGGATAPPTGSAPSPAAPLVSARLTLSHLRLRPARFRAARHGRRAGTTVSYRLSGAGTVRFAVQRCRSARRCQAVGTFRHRSRAGANNFRFRGRVAGHTLRPARYRLVARPLQPDGRLGRTSRVTFHVIRRAGG